jgi:hypothetical protein
VEGFGGRFRWKVSVSITQPSKPSLWSTMTRKGDFDARSPKRQKVEQSARPVPAAPAKEPAPSNRVLTRFGLTRRDYAVLPGSARTALLKVDEKWERAKGLSDKLLRAREHQEAVRQRRTAAVEALAGELDVASTWTHGAERAAEKAMEEYEKAETLYFNCGGVEKIMD